MSNENLFDKEIELRVPLYKFQRQLNLADEDYDDEPKFIGREIELQKFVDVLETTKKGGGAFLVSGYRGAGKTRFVKRALLNYTKPKNKKKKTNVIDVKVNLGNDTRLDSRTILSDMVTLLREDISKKISDTISYPKILPVMLGILSALSRVIVFFLISLLLLMLFFPKTVYTFSPLSTDVSFFFWALVFSVTIALTLYGSVYRYLENRIEILSALDDLILRIHAASEKSTQVDSQLGNKKIGHLRKIWTQKYTSNPIGTIEIELRLQRILESSDFDVFFIFDELDKLSGTISDDFETSISSSQDTKYRKRQVDRLLGELKNLITRSKARYIFIAGRDMYDAYLGESGSTNSLYESLFSGHIYIPSLHTDHTDGETYLLDSMIETFVVSKLMKCDENGKLKKDGKSIAVKLIDYNDVLENNSDQIEVITELHRMQEDIETIFLLKIFIHFLAFHSWGNYKRLITLFESFVRKKLGKDEYEIFFGTKDIQRLLLASHLYILFHHNLSQTLMNADDKLVVSAFSVYHYIMKYHGMGFSRFHINRMYEAINIHSSPELSRIVDEIIGNVLNNHIRRVRNSFYRYRFSSLYERELHYITTISDNDSASFNFSLDAMESVKQHYIDLLDDYKRTSDRNYEISMAPIRTVLGDYLFWEQSHDEASVQYGIASKILEEHQTENDVNTVIKLVEVYLKKASVAERSGNLTMAVAIYMQAELHVEKSKILSQSAIGKQDSKWDVVLQPYWARRFLNLKRSAIHYSNVNNDSNRMYKNNEVHQYRTGVLALFMENHQEAYSNFIGAAEKVDVLNAYNERASFLGGNACLKAGLTLLGKFGSDTHKKLAKIERQIDRNEDHYTQKKEALCNVLEPLLEQLAKIFEGLKDIHTLESLKSQIVDKKQVFWSNRTGHINERQLRV